MSYDKARTVSWGSTPCLGLIPQSLKSNIKSLGTMSVPQEEIQVLSEWAMTLPPSLGLSFVTSGGPSTLTKAVGSGAGGQTAPPGRTKLLSGSFLKGLRNK